MTISHLTPAAATLWDDARAALPLVAILRGLTPPDSVPIAGTLIATGFRLIEVPLNSPDAFESIRLMVEAFGGTVLIGAGTVLDVAQVEHLAAIGGRLCISPNTDTDVIARARALGMVSMPAFQTPSEAFVAIKAGATALKLFPANTVGADGLKAMNAVLPRAVPIFPVGGVSADGFKPYVDAGAAGFGIGSDLYRPGATVADVTAKAARLMEAWRLIAK